jgi:bifunctional non-homologous end joining protein LigD
VRATRQKADKTLPWVEPMLATLTSERFTRKEWIFEPKFDGVRCLCMRTGNEANLYSRNKILQNDRYPEIVEAVLRQKADNFIIDGEIVAFKGSLTSFSELQRRMRTAADDALKASVPVFYYLFDLIYFESASLADLPLLKRKEILEASFTFRDPLRFTPHRRTFGERYYAEACRLLWEGLIAKKADSLYRSGRSSDWLKFKCTRRQEFVIGGFTDSTSAANPFGALLLGYYDGEKKLSYAGKVGTGFGSAFFLEMKQKLRRLESKGSPFQRDVSEKGVHWVRPALVAEVEFTEWTPDGKLRHPSFMGLRADKSAREIVREVPV